MGYSIMTPFHSVEARDTMFAFLEENYKDYTKIFPVTKKMKEEYYPSLPLLDLSYGPKRKIPVIGFDYGAGTNLDDKDYAFSICYWMAVHGGARKNFKKYSNMPYVIYDGIEEWALFVNEKRDSTIECVSVDEFGFRPTPDLFPKTGILQLLMKPYEKKKKKYDAAIKEELMRLSSIWFGLKLKKGE